MNCKHCGYPVNRGQKVCPGCGKPVRRKRGLAVFLSILVILALIVCVGLNLRTIGNFVTQRGASDVAYYQHVETQHADDLFRLAGLLTQKGEAKSAARHTLADLQLTLAESAQQFLSELNTGAIKLGWIQSLGLSLDLRQDGLVGADVGVLLNDVSLVSLDATVDPAGGGLALKIPELTEQVLRLPAEDLSELLRDRPAAGDPQARVRRCLTRALENLQTVERGTDTLTAGGISRSYTTLTVQIDAATGKAIGLAVCEELRGDAELRQAIVEAAGEDAYTSFLAELDETAADVEKNGLFDRTATMTVYVDAGGTLCGRLIRFEGTDASESFTLLFALPRQGLRYGLTLRLENAAGTVTLTGGGKLQGLTLDGNFEFLRDADVFATGTAQAVLKGLIKGEAQATILPGEALLNALDLPVEAESFGRELALELRGSNLDGVLTASAELTRALEPVVSLLLAIRSGEPAETPVMSDGLSLSEWRASIKLPGLLSSGSFGTIFDNLKQAGMPGELITGLKLLLPTLLK